MSFQLLFTSALKDEIPPCFLQDHHIPIIHLHRSSQSLSHYKTAPMLWVITGVGPDNARRAMALILDKLSPYCVINIGACATLLPSLNIGDVVVAKRFIKHKHNPIDNAPFFPFYLDRYHQVDSLYTSPKPIQSDAWPDASDIVDMEAYEQASYCKKKGVFFFCLKVVSDYGDLVSIRQFKERLPSLHRAIKHSLGFVKVALDKIDVIIPVFNRVQMLKRAIDSALKQDYLGQVIVVNDGSNKATTSVIDSYNNTQVTHIKLARNHGVSYARNQGVKASCSYYLAFLDSDDEWLAHKLADQVRYLRRYPFFEILQSQEIWIKHGQPKAIATHLQKKQGWIWEHALARCMISPSSVLLSRRLFDAYGGFDLTLPACEDYDLWAKIARHYLIGLDDSKNLIRYAGHHDQLSSRYEAMDRFRLQTLVRLLKEEYSIEGQAQLHAMLHKKLSILKQGAKKRNKQDDLSYYCQLATTHSSLSKKLEHAVNC